MDVLQRWGEACWSSGEMVKQAARPAIFKGRQTEPELILCAVHFSPDECRNYFGTAGTRPPHGHEKRFSLLRRRLISAAAAAAVAAGAALASGEAVAPAAKVARSASQMEDQAPKDLEVL